MGFITPPSDLSGAEATRNPADNAAPLTPLLVCPRCQSEDWKAAPLVHLEGFSAVNLRTKGVSVGAGVVGLRDGKFAVGGAVQKGRAHGIQQTLLSAQLTPPRKRSNPVALLIILCLLFLFFGWGLVTGIEHENIIAILINSTLTLVLAYALTLLERRQQRQHREYEVAVKNYENTRVCQRCGTLYLGRIL